MSTYESRSGESTPGISEIDPQMTAVIDAFQQVLGEPMRDIGAVEIRTRRQEMASAGHAEDMAVVEELSISGRNGDIPARRYRPGPGAPRGVVVYFHGGGWVFGSVEESDTLCRALAKRSGADVISVDYRLAPEHRYPAAAHDAIDAVRWTADSVGAGTPLIVMGDSAGGNIAVAATQAVSHPVALQVLVYPVLDGRMTNESYRTRGQKLLISADDMDYFWNEYIPDVSRRSEPTASPGLVADVSGQPPTVLIIAGYDPNRDEGLEYGRRLEESGVPVTVHEYSSVAHGFFTLPHALPAADSAVRAAADAVSAVTA